MFRYRPDNIIMSRSEVSLKYSVTKQYSVKFIVNSLKTNELVNKI